LLNTDDSFARHQLNYAINQQEGIAVRQKILYGLRIENSFHSRKKRNAGKRNKGRISAPGV